MARSMETVAQLVDEYRSLLCDAQSISGADEELNWDSVARTLEVHGEWTRRGADHVANIARSYGSFVLRNALAVCLALDHEDGELGL